MPLSYYDIVNADLSVLSDAATAWKKMGKKLEKLRNNYKTHVHGVTGDSSWTGESAKAFDASARTTHHEFYGAEKQATAIGNLLEDAHGRLSRLKKKVERVKEEAQANNMHVTPSGRCIYDYNTGSSEEGRSAPRHDPDMESSAEEWTREISKAVEAVSDADEGVRKALEAISVDNDGKGLKDGFNSKAVQDLNKANADEAVDLARAGRDISNSDLERLTTLLDRNGDNQGFATRFAKRMGPEGTLEFWSEMNPYPANGAREDILNRTRKALGTTLAKATHSRSPDMTAWKNEMYRLGSRKFNKDDLEVADGYGFQIMADLMRNGDYDSRFLKEYTDKAVEFERKQAGKGTNPEDLWVTGDNIDVDTFKARETGDGSARWSTDPITSLMAGLADDPEASNSFFTNQDKFDYVVGGGRDWPEAMLPSGEWGQGHDQLGHALETAVKGVPYDDSSDGLKRGDDQIKVMQKVMEAYQDSNGLRESQPGISDSLGRMGAAYVDRINYGLEMYGGGSAHGLQEAFDIKNVDDIYPPTVRGFMAELGRDEATYQKMSQAQEIFTMSLMNDPAENVDPYRAAELGAKGHGVLDERRAEEIGQKYKDMEQEANRAKEEELTESANWAKGLSSATVYGIAGGVGTATLGPAFLMPAVAGASGSGATSFLNELIDNRMQPQEEFDNTGKSIEHIKDFRHHAEIDAKKMIRLHHEKHDLAHDPMSEKLDDVDKAYEKGTEMGNTDDAF